MIDLIIEQRRIPQLLETKLMCSDEEYWCIDLASNLMEYNPNNLKKLLLKETLSYLDTNYLIIGVEFFSIMKDKIVLIVKRNEFVN